MILRIKKGKMVKKIVKSRYKKRKDIYIDIMKKGMKIKMK
jgi:hypothetical protein